MCLKAMIWLRKTASWACVKPIDCCPCWPAWSGLTPAGWLGCEVLACTSLKAGWEMYGWDRLVVVLCVNTKSYWYTDG